MPRSRRAAWSRSSPLPATTWSSRRHPSLARKEHVLMPEFLTTSPFLGVAVVIIVLLLIAFVASRYKVAGANEALIVAGSRGSKVRDERGQTVSAPGDKGVKVVVGGGTLVMPLINRVGKLKLTARQISVQLADA